MAPGEMYRARAGQFEAWAKEERDPKIVAEFESLARAYRRLARQAESNSTIDLVYETPPSKSEPPVAR